MSRWFHAFSARSPENPDEEHWEVGIQQEKFRLLQSKGHIVKLSRLILVEKTLEDTVTLVSGWSRPDKDDCFVYVGRPKNDYRGPQIETPAPPGMLFLVFVLPDGTVDDWAWRPQSEDDPDIPQGVKGEVIWPQD